MQYTSILPDVPQPNTQNMLLTQKRSVSKHKLQTKLLLSEAWFATYHFT